MFVLRDELLAALGQATLREFKLRAAAHLRAEFSAQTHTMTAADLLAAVDLGLQRAEGYGLLSEAGIVGYLELMFRWGRDFDTDSALPFAARILQEREVFEREPSLARLLEVEEDVAEAERGGAESGYARRHEGSKA